MPNAKQQKASNHSSCRRPPRHSEPQSRGRTGKAPRRSLSQKLAAAIICDIKKSGLVMTLLAVAALVVSGVGLKVAMEQQSASGNIVVVPAGAYQRPVPYMHPPSESSGGQHSNEPGPGDRRCLPTSPVI